MFSAKMTHTLKKIGSHGFYSQIQYAMLCSVKQLCFFFLCLRLENRDVMLEIPFNDGYIPENISAGPVLFVFNVAVSRKGARGWQIGHVL